MTNNLPTSAPENSNSITKDMLIGALPDKRFRRNVTDDLVDLVNSETDSELRRAYKDNILGYMNVLTGGRFSLTAYICAVKFVSLKLLGDNSSTAYAKVFPDRYQNLVNSGATGSKIASFASNYEKNALVVKILEQTMVPTHILNANIYQEAINTQADLMRNANSEMVRQKAAESLLNNLKAPEVAKVEIDVKHSDSVVDDLRETTRALARQQKELIANGHMTARDVAHSDIIGKKVEHKKEEVVEAEYTEVLPEPEPEPVNVIQEADKDRALFD